MGFIKTPEQRVPCLLSVGSSAKILKQPRRQMLDHLLVGIRIVPPVAGGRVPTGGFCVAYPYHSSGVDPLSCPHRIVGLFAGLERVGRGHSSALLRDRRNKAGSLSYHQGLQEAPSTHETAPYDFVERSSRSEEQTSEL